MKSLLNCHVMRDVFSLLVGGWDHADIEAGLLCRSPAAKCKEPEPAVWQLPHAAAP